jgi:hypothetical protein
MQQIRAEQSAFSRRCKALKVDPVTFMPVNNGNSNAWTGGLSLQFSIRYLAGAHVRNLAPSSCVAGWVSGAWTA